MLFHHNSIYCAYDFLSSMILTRYAINQNWAFNWDEGKELKTKYQSNHKVTAFNFGALETISGPEAGCWGPHRRPAFPHCQGQALGN